MVDPDIARLHATVGSFLSFVEDLPRSELAPAPWGAREVLAHLVYWHEHYVRIVRARIDGRASELPDAPFNELNARAVARLRPASIAGLVGRLRVAQAELERLSARATSVPCVVSGA